MICYYSQVLKVISELRRKALGYYEINGRNTLG